MSEIKLSLEEIFNLAKEVLSSNGCDEISSNAVATTVSTAERDGSASHGLFRIPGRRSRIRGGVNWLGWLPVL